MPEMLGDMLKDSPDAFRPDLWRRCESLGPQLCAEARRSWPMLSETDIEDLWTDLVADAAQAAGKTGAMDAGAEGLSDAERAKWLRTGLHRDCHDLHRKRTRSDDGRPWIDGAASDNPERPAPGIWTTLEHSPEDRLINGARFGERAQDVVELVGQDGLRLLVAEASGISRHEHGRLLGLTKSRLESVRDRLEYAADELRARGQAAIVWLWPEAALRWVLSLGGAGGGAMLSVSGVGKGVAAVIVAAGAVAAGGSAIVHDEKLQATIRPAVTKGSSQGARSPVQAAVSTAVQRSERIVQVDRQRQQRRTAAVSVKRKQAATQRKRAAARKKAIAARRTQAAAPKRSASVSSGTSTAAQEFSPGVAASSAAPAPRAPAPVRSAPKASSSGSTAANEFLPSGR